MNIVIVGAGFGGISAAALLAQKGLEVTVIEKNEGPGGRASVYSEGGFTFDMGPSWYLMPDVFENFFAEFNAKPEDFYDLKKLEPAYRVFSTGEGSLMYHLILKRTMNSLTALRRMVVKDSGSTWNQLVNSTTRL